MRHSYVVTVAFIYYLMTLSASNVSVNRHQLTCNVTFVYIDGLIKQHSLLKG